MKFKWVCNNKVGSGDCSERSERCDERNEVEIDVNDICFNFGSLSHATAETHRGYWGYCRKCGAMRIFSLTGKMDDYDLRIELPDTKLEMVSGTREDGGS